MAEHNAVSLFRGSWLTWIDRRYFRGISLVLVTISLMLGVKFGMVRGTTPILLSIVGALSGSSLILIGIAGKSGAVCLRILCRGVGPPVMRFLLQPIVLRSATKRKQIQY